MAGETKPAPFLKQTKKKKIVLIGEKHQSLIRISFTLSIQPHPSSEWRDDRAQLTLSLFGPPPILPLYTQTIKAYQPTHFNLQATALQNASFYRMGLRSPGMPKYWLPSHHFHRVAHQPDWSGPLQIIFCNDHLATHGWPHSTEEGMGRPKATEKVNKPNQQPRM